MHLRSFIPLLAILTACTPVVPPSPKATTTLPQPIESREIPAVTPPRKQPTPTVVRPNLPSPSKPSLSRATIAGIRFEGVSFDARTHRLTVADQPNGPGSIWPTSEAACNAKGGLAAINASFFAPSGAPLGLVISAGKRSGSWNSASSLGSGIYLQTGNNLPSIRRRSSRSAVSSAAHLIQAGPLLVENSSPVKGLNASDPAARSILLTDGTSRWWLGKTSACTLAALGKALSNTSPASWDVAQALNLDGGRSSDLFISSEIPGGPVNSRGFFNKPVRNFLVLTRK